MGVFKKPIFVLAVLTACSGSHAPGVLPLSSDAVQRQGLKQSDFKRIAAWGAKGKLAIVQCPQGYKVVAGGSSSSDGSSVGTGYADSNGTGWIVKPNANASAEAFATCVESATVGKSFRWQTAYGSSDVSAAQCPVGSMLVTGYASGTPSASWFNASTNTYWVEGDATANASCVANNAGIVIRHAWNKSQKPKTVFAGCGNGYSAIGGAMGNSAWPGPPIQQHPGNASGPGSHGYAGWWTFSNALNELTWVACVRT